MSDSGYKKYECVICGYIYDEAEGIPEDGIPPGTLWKDIPEDWECTIEKENIKRRLYNNLRLNFMIIKC